MTLTDRHLSALRVAERDRLAERAAALEKVYEAARHMPRATPAPGAASTVHLFQIEAGTVWDLDRALKQVERAALAQEPSDGQ